MKSSHQQKPVTPQEIWRILKDLSKSQRETERIINRSKREARQAKREARQEASQVWKMVRETTKQMKETDREIKETAQQLRKTEALFYSKWGKLVESLVEGKLVELLQDRGIDVSETYSRIQRSYTDEKGELQRREIDIIAANGKEVVAVEVKTTLKPGDIKYFLETLKIFKRYFSIYANKTVYGAVAYLKSDAKASLFAERKGLFVIQATGDSASLVNKPNFKPNIF